MERDPLRLAWKTSPLRHLAGFGLLALALFLAVMAASMTHTDLVRKPFWLVLALTSAAASGGSMSRSGMLLIRQPLGSGA